MTKSTKWHVRPVKTQISQGIHPVWSESSHMPFCWFRHDVAHICIFWTHYYMLKPHCTSFRIIYSNCCGCPNFPIFTVSNNITQNKNSEDSDQTGLMPTLICVFTGRIDDHYRYGKPSLGAQMTITTVAIWRWKNAIFLWTKCFQKPYSKPPL